MTEDDSPSCPACGVKVTSTAKFCVECGNSLQNDNTETSQETSDDSSAQDSQSSEESEDTKAGSFDDVDLSNIDPKQDWECFGFYEEENVECRECPVKGDCASETNSN